MSTTIETIFQDKIKLQLMNTFKLVFVFILCSTILSCKQSASANDTTIVSKESDTKKTTESNVAAEDTSSTIETKEVETDTANVSKGKTSANHKPLTIIVTNLTSADAPIVVGLYGTKNKFPKPKGELKVYRFKPSGKELKASITDLKYGTYALAIYQDINSNKKIDKNLIGVPTEAYAFSNNYKPTVKAPNFNDCKFIYNTKTNTVNMKMIQ